MPSPIADLDGYRATRRTITRSHRIREPLLELGQDAFQEVLQPTLVVVATPEPGAASEAPFRLEERQWADRAAAPVEPPEVLRILLSAPSLPAVVFRELGFQTSRKVTERLLHREPPPADISPLVPLLEGRNVREFLEDSPRLYLHADPRALADAGARLRSPEQYLAVQFVVRQTASFPIAARHRGVAFRNSLLAGFPAEGFSADLCVGLLNSALYRALHVAARRDARQAAFPQVKIAHLRSLPAPPSVGRESVESLSREFSAGRAVDREALDAAVFDLFAIPPDHRLAVCAFLGQRAPALGYPTSAPVPHSSLEIVRRSVEQD
jgi:hypothetical protein